ncbi:MAG TPA: DUF4872 domain-containing protein [Solirubrobacteraceae bacterium]|jgi:hypothetical protein|nr:DUF4872 domain-containing protein [Solirubrobacteraceae bacterium]
MSDVLTPGLSDGRRHGCHPGGRVAADSAATTCAAAPVQHRVADHAASGALRDVLAHHALSYARQPLSEGTVFGLSGALDLAVRVAGGAVPPIDLEGRAPSLELELCRHLGIEAQWLSTDDPARGCEQLRRELDAGHPVLLRADVGELDYHVDCRHDTRHVILVTGCDVQAGIVWVLDRCFPEPQRCTLSSLAAARASRGWPEPARHGLLRLRVPGALPEPRGAIGAALWRVVRSMREPSSSGHPHVRSGLAGVDALAHAWPQLPRLAGPRLGQTLAGLRFRVRDGGTGGALYRSLQARFEHDAAALLEAPQLGRAALVCDDLADAWRAFAAATEDDDCERAHRVASDWVQRIHALEHRHVEALELHLWLDEAAHA